MCVRQMFCHAQHGDATLVSGSRNPYLVLHDITLTTTMNCDNSEEGVKGGKQFVFLLK